jgi:uncharacterized protein YdeI (YjbR/CyaY-like superfamily)
MPSDMKPKFFKSPADWRAWLEKNHATAREIVVGFHKKASGKPSITWPESVDEALCYGWIDGVRRSLDENSYTIRFTPRKHDSIWSLVNTKRVAELTKEKRMRPAGLQAFERRDPKKTGIYSFEREHTAFPPEYEKAFRSNAKAWSYFCGSGEYYKRVAMHWVTSAKQEATRQRRMAELIRVSEKGEKPKPFTLEKKQI